MLGKARHFANQVSQHFGGRVERDLTNELPSLSFDLQGELLVDLETLQKHRLQALREECNGKPQILVERLLNEVTTLRQVSMENKIEAVRVDRDLVGNLFLLVVQEVFQELLFLLLVISLTYETMPPTDFIVAEDGPLHDLLQNELVLRVTNLVVDLPQSKPG